MPVLQVVRAAGEDLGRVAGIGAAVPCEQSACGVAGHRVEFFAQDFAADAEALLGIAESGEKWGRRSLFPGRPVPSLALSPN